MQAISTENSKEREMVNAPNFRIPPPRALNKLLLLESWTRIPEISISLARSIFFSRSLFFSFLSTSVEYRALITVSRRFTSVSLIGGGRSVRFPQETSRCSNRGAKKKRERERERKNRWKSHGNLYRGFDEATIRLLQTGQDLWRPLRD